MELLIGAGSARDKRLWNQGHERWDGLVTVDLVGTHRPDVVCDLNHPLPFATSVASEIHAYEVLEHLGRQGDAEGFLGQFSEFWRVLRPGGLFFATVPWWNSRWGWGDPGHTRLIQPETLVYLVYPEYERQVGTSPMSDYRGVYDADFDILHSERVSESFHFVLRAIKPRR